MSLIDRIKAIMSRDYYNKNEINVILENQSGSVESPFLLVKTFSPEIFKNSDFSVSIKGFIQDTQQDEYWYIIPKSFEYFYIYGEETSAARAKLIDGKIEYTKNDFEDIVTQET